MTFISISLSLGIPFLLLYRRKREWYNKNLKQVLFIGMSLIGLVGFFLSEANENRFFFFSFLTTPVFLIIDYGLKNLSLLIHSRDFYLWLRYSEEIDDSIRGIGKNKHVKTTDIIFSLSLVILIVGLSVLGAILFGKDALYDKLMN